MVNMWDQMQNPAVVEQIGGKFFTAYPAVVVANEDPTMRGHIKVKCNMLIGDRDTWWLPPMSPAGGFNDLGFFWVPEIGAQVWIMCLCGDPDFMMWFATTWPHPKGKENAVPKLARQVPDETTESPKGDDTAQSAPIPSPRTLKEPQSPYAADYPFNRVIKTLAGHVIELDDTVGQERVHVWHNSGTYFEIDKVGNLTMRVMGNFYHVVEGDYQLHVKGDMDVVVEGNRTTKINKSLSVEVAGDKLQTIEGSVLENINAAGCGPVLTSIAGMQQIIKANKYEEITIDKNIQIDQNEDKVIGVSKTDEIGMNQEQTIGMADKQTVGTQQDITVGLAQTQTAGVSMTNTTPLLTQAVVGVHTNTSPVFRVPNTKHDHGGISKGKSRTKQDTYK